MSKKPHTPPEKTGGDKKVDKTKRTTPPSSSPMQADWDAENKEGSSED